MASCPYQYYAQKILSIGASEWPDDEIDAGEIGTIWHKAIELFHKQRNAQKPSKDREVFIKVLQTQFKLLCAENPRYWEVQERLLSYVDSFILWWYARENEGWQVVQSEYSPSQNEFQSIRDENDQELHRVTWKGRIDEIQARDVGEADTDSGNAQWSLIDFKSGNIQTFRSKIKNNEDIQLAFYIQLIDSTQRDLVSSAYYVGVSKDGDSPCPEVALDDEKVSLQTQALNLYQQVHDLFLRMLQGQTLIAFGQAQGACGYCEYRAVCRKDYSFDLPSNTPKS